MLSYTPTFRSLFSYSALRLSVLFTCCIAVLGGCGRDATIYSDGDKTMDGSDASPSPGDSTFPVNFPEPKNLKVDPALAVKLKDALTSAGLPGENIRPLFMCATGTAAFGVATSGDKAVDIWRKLHAAIPAHGFYPVIIGDDESLNRIYESLTFDAQSTTTADILEAAEKISQPSWLESRYANLLKEFDTSAAEFEAEPAGSPEKMTRFSVPYGIGTEKPLKVVNILLVPVKNGWEVPAALLFGGWNDCPAPEEQVSALRYWHDKYGAELVCLSGDVLEAQVSRPPKTKEEAMTLARQQYAYCYDIVDQGVDTIQALASTLQDGNQWYFWWD
jgi:hypothetical protein